MSDRYTEAGNRGHSYIWEQRWEEAVREFEFAISGRPNEPDLYDGLATAYRGLNQLGKALDNYQEAARLSKGDPIYLEQVGDIQQKLGQYPAAARTFLAVGEIRLRERRLDEAIDRWMLASRLDPDLLTAHQRLAAIYQRQGKSVQALHEHMEVARLHEAQGELDKALDACRIALELDPRNPDVLTAIELLERGETAFDKIETNKPTLTLAPTNVNGATPAVRRRRVVPIEQAKQLARERLAEDVFSMDGGDAAAQMQLMTLISQGLDYQTRGVIREAISSFEQVVRAGLTSPSTYFSLGILYREDNRYEDAIRHLQQATEAPEYRLASHFALGESYRDLSQISNAIDHFITVLQIIDLATVARDKAPTLSNLYEQLGQSLKSERDRDRANTFANALFEFLSNEKWEEQVQRSRVRLDEMSDGPGTMILGEIMTAGSASVLDVLFLAQQHASEGLYDTAIEEIYRAIELSPNYMPSHLRMAEILLKQGRVDQATQKLMMIGNTYQARFDIPGAIQAYQRAVEMSPLNMETRGQLIGLLKNHRQIDAVIEQYLGMGEAFYQMAQVDRARQSYVEGMKLASRGTSDLTWRTQLLKRIGDIDLQRFDWRQALPIYRELRRLAPDDERAAITYIDLNFKVGDGKSGLKELDRYLVQLAKSGQANKLQGVLEELVEQRPGEPGIVDRLVRLYQQQKRSDKAIELLDRLGEIQFDAGNQALAVKTIEKILTLNPPNRADYEQLLAQMRGQ